MRNELRHWENLRAFATVAQVGSLTAAAPILGSNIATVSRRLGELQKYLGVSLFRRQSKGMNLTTAGHSILADAQAMAVAADNIDQRARGAQSEMSGVVRVTATEGIGAYWLTPRFLTFQQRHPGLTISLDTTGELRDLAEENIDIAIRFSNPGADSNIARAVGELNMIAFAARSYLRQYGYPESIEDIKNHFLVHYEQSPKSPFWKEFDLVAQSARGITFQSNSSNAVRRAIIEGYGIGFMPSYVLDIDFSLEALPIALPSPLKVWVVSRPETNRVGRVRATLDYIYELFETDRQKYFSDMDVMSLKSQT